MQSPSLVLRAEPSASPLCSTNLDGSLRGPNLQSIVHLFGSHAAWLLTGFLIIMTYSYSIHSSRDHWLFKMLVYTSVSIAMVQSVMEAILTHNQLVTFWGNSRLLSDSPTTSRLIFVVGNIQPIFDAFPALFVQSFFTWRIWTISMAICVQNWIRLFAAAICVFIIFSSTCAFALAITFAALFYTPVAISQSTISVVVVAWSVSAALADIVIVICMVIILRNAKSRAYFGETRDRISRLLRLTIQTGLLTTILALPTGPVFLRAQDSSMYALPLFLLGKSYVISLLFNLNARAYKPPVVMRGGWDTSVNDTHEVEPAPQNQHNNCDLVSTT